jgi:hypothetical protein
MPEKGNVVSVVRAHHTSTDFKKAVLVVQRRLNGFNGLGTDLTERLVIPFYPFRICSIR